MITRHRSGNEDAIISQLIMETPRKNVNKDGIRLLGSRPIDPKQRIIIFKQRDETGVSKILRKIKGDNVFLGCVVRISTVCIKCVPRKGQKNSLLNKYTKVGKRCFNLNREANYRPQSAFDERTEEGISVVMFAFLSIFHWDSCYYL